MELKENLDRTKESIEKKALADAKMEADKILDGFDQDMQELREYIGFKFSIAPL